MIKIEKTDIYGFESAIRGMRNPMNSWDKSDSDIHKVTECTDCPHYGKECHKHILNGNACFHLGENDLKLMKSLSNAGTDHSKFLRMINVTVDITAPLYWWKEFDTYKVGTVANSCSTMHKIHDKEFTLDDFSCEHLKSFEHTDVFNDIYISDCKSWLQTTINQLNWLREHYLRSNKNKDYWWQMIQLLPSSYNQKRTVQLNYQVLKSMYFARKNHKLDEWVDFCKWCETLPYFCDICINN